MAQNKRLLYTEGGEKKEIYSKTYIISDKIIFFWKTVGVYQADYLTSPGQVVPD